MIEPAEIRQMIRSVIPDAKVEISDMTGTNDHFEIYVSSKAFQHKSLIEQHRMVFAALENEMKDRIHAVKLRTRAF